MTTPMLPCTPLCADTFGDLNGDNEGEDSEGAWAPRQPGFQLATFVSGMAHVWMGDDAGFMVNLPPSVICHSEQTSLD